MNENNVNDYGDYSDSQSSEIPMSEQREQEYEYTASGRSIKEPISMILKRASQGYDYAQKMNEFNTRNQEFENKYKTYAEIDNYAQTNPDWWSHVVNNYSNKDQYQQPQNQNQYQNQYNDPRYDSINNELSELKKFKEEYVSEKRRQQQEQEDLKLKEEIETIQKQYKNIDFSNPDESGKSLEVKVMEYAVQNGIKSFKTAFRDFYHDELLKRAQMDGKDSAVREVQKKTKLGLLGETQAPTKGISRPESVRGKSYGDLAQEALRELGL